ncbi:uncharacterized protein B0I36DRAFT_94629 [Microdochium trichocladiopsis]|uniref:Uncharacterized protein n=1 Tax=Microdochium trichocladiopsis TaxID=1682393 RepID=A0A9P9BT60_9PEZI|nr:uncharacterized protein B0I36DRAFT_94629 [Microdochium trichocladiopsis]KAH7035610.1 hypothetical protein B0I36DRAFT_94629 [Microdochium trichocladiopsis]
MSWLKPFKLLIVPFVFIVAVPLAICAGLTTILAFLVLFFRLFVVYFDLAIDTLRYVLLGRSFDNTASPASRSPHATTPTPSSPTQLSPRRRRNRRDSSTASIRTTGSFDGLPLSLGSALERDFEGVGGWRLKSADADPGGTDDQQWYSLNSRLEMPDRKHHFRTRSGGDINPGSRSAIGLYGMKAVPRTGQQSPEAARMTASPTFLRARTPTGVKQRGLTRLDQDGYFPPYENRPTRRIAV